MSMPTAETRRTSERNDRLRAINTFLAVLSAVALTWLAKDALDNSPENTDNNPPLVVTATETEPDDNDGIRIVTATPSPTFTPSPTATQTATSQPTATRTPSPTATATATESYRQYLASPNRDESPSLVAAQNLRINGVTDYLRRFDFFSQNRLELFSQSPAARRFFSEVEFGSFTDWAEELSPEEALSQNFQAILSTEEGRAAVEEANALFGASLTARNVNGEDTLVFTNHPGSDEAGFEDLWIPSQESGDNYLRSTIVTEGFENMERALYAQLVGYARTYAEHYQLPWSQTDFTHIADRLLSTYLNAGFEKTNGTFPLYYLGADNIVRAEDSAFNLNVRTRRLQAQPDAIAPQYGDRDDQDLQWQCIAITDEGYSEPASFPGELDGEDATWTSEIVAINPSELPFTNEEENFIQMIVQGEYMNIRSYHEHDEHALENVPGQYETSPEYLGDSRTYLAYGYCALAVPAPRVQPTTAATQPPYVPPENTPRPPENTPVPPTEAPEKAPNEDEDGDGGYIGGPFDDDEPVDVPVPTPQPLPTSPPAESTPPSDEEVGF